MSRDIEVRSEDIATAERGNSYHCVVANAIVRTYPDARHVVVDAQTIRFTRQLQSKRYVFMTPPSIQSYIVDFDAGLPITPFDFSLRAPIWTGPVAVGKNHGMGIAHINISAGSAKDKKHLHVPNKRAPAIRPHGAYRRFGLRLLRENQG